MIATATIRRSVRRAPERTSSRLRLHLIASPKMRICTTGTGLRYTGNHSFYCGIDLHPRKMYLCIFDSEGEIVFHRNITASREPFLKAIAAFRENLVVCCECMHCWYWLADLCFEEGIKFVLGHAYYMKAIHGGKSKNDRIDSEKIARLLRGGLIPMAYVYPHDLLSAHLDVDISAISDASKRAEISGLKA